MSSSAMISPNSSISPPADTAMKSALTLRLAEIKSQTFGMLLASRMDSKDDDYSATLTPCSVVIVPPAAIV